MQGVRNAHLVSINKNAEGRIPSMLGVGHYTVAVKPCGLFGLGWKKEIVCTLNGRFRHERMRRDSSNDTRRRGTTGFVGVSKDDRQRSILEDRSQKKIDTHSKIPYILRSSIPCRKELH